MNGGFGARDRRDLPRRYGRLHIRLVGSFRRSGGVLLAGLLGIAAPVSTVTAALPTASLDREATGCDRRCLADLVENYLAALVAHDPQRLAWASAARLTENSAPLRIGDGLWSTASGLGRFRLTFIDPVQHAVAFYGTLYENGTPVILALRLKMAGHRIAEAEHIVVRNPAAAARFDARTADPAMTLPAPLNRRPSRDALAAAAGAYFDGIEAVSAKAIPFAPDCRRVENGQQTTGIADLAHGPFLELDSPSWRAVLAEGCAGSIDSGANAHITEIRDRRMVVLDEENSVAVAIATFVHPGTVAQVHTAGHAPISFPAQLRQPFDTLIMEAFKLDRDGAIVRIEAAGAMLPYGLSTGWPH